ncbi:MAG: VirB4-like conjugal transfer ATPase, partial [Eggerthella lenta]
MRVQGAASRLLAALASRRSKEKDPGRDEARARSSKKRCSSADAASFIAYDALYKDGIAEVEPGLFSQTVEFSDISYQSARKETQEQIFTTLSSLYNYFPAESSVQLTIVNTPIPRELIGKKVFFEPNDERTLGYVDEYKRILNDKMCEGVSNLVRRRFLTYSVPAESVEAAVPKLSHIRSDIASTLARIRCDAAPLGGQERLEAISTLVRPGHTPSCDWDKLSQHPRLRTKDLIAPNLMDFAPAGRADAVEIDGMYASVLTLRDFGSVLEDHYLASIIDLPIPLAVSVHIAPIVQSEALALVKRQIDWMDKEII